MARTKKGAPPAYPARPHNGQARLTVRLTTGKRYCLYLGLFGSPESRKEYQHVLALLEAHGCYPTKEDGRAAPGLTLDEVALAFWKHAEGYLFRSFKSASNSSSTFGSGGLTRW